LDYGKDVEDSLGPLIVSFSSSLAIVMRRTQRLPVALIPEQPHVATVRDDVVNQRRRDYPVLRQALDA